MTKLVNITRLTDPYNNAEAGPPYTRSDLNGSLSEGLTSRRKVYFQASSSDIGLVFENTFYSGGEVANPSPITVKGSIEAPDGTIMPFTFAGDSSVTFAGGTIAQSDMLSFAVSAGDYVWVRTFVQVNPSQVFPLNIQLNIGIGEGDNQLLTATPPTDLTGGGTIPASAGQQGNCSYAASLVIGHTSSRSIYLIGDSIMTGVADAAGNGTLPETYYRGYGVLALTRSLYPYSHKTSVKYGRSALRLAPPIPMKSNAVSPGTEVLQSGI